MRWFDLSKYCCDTRHIAEYFVVISTHVPTPTAQWRSKALLLVLLTLGAHAPEGYGSCPVCVSVRNLNLGTGASRGLNEGTSE